MYRWMIESHFVFLLSQFVCNRPKKTHTNLHTIISSLILIFCTATNFWVFTRAGALISPLRNWCCHKKLLHSNIFCCIRTNTYSTRCYFRKNRIWTIAQQEVQKMFRFYLYGGIKNKSPSCTENKFSQINKCFFLSFTRSYEMKRVRK